MKRQSAINNSTSGSPTLVVDSVWQPSAMTVAVSQTAYEACVSPMRPIDKGLRARFGDASQRKAVKYYPGTSVSGAVWHHGEHYVISIKGSAATVLEHCAISQTMRENILLEATRRSTHGREVMAVATGRASVIPDSLEHISLLDFVGFVIVKPVAA